MLNFKKLFRKTAISSENTRRIKTGKNIEVVSLDINEIIAELDNYLCEICANGEKLELLTVHQKNFFYNQSLEKEINNGGFKQFYFNSSGDYAHETIGSLKSIGANKTAALLEKANNQFPN